MATGLSNLISDLPDPEDPVGYYDIHAPFICSGLYSNRADPVGLRRGQFVVDNARLAVKLDEDKKKLVAATGLDIGITHFENQAPSLSFLVMLFKPKTRKDICTVIKTIRDPQNKINIKVGMGGAYHSWSPMFPDAGNLLINTCDIVFPEYENESGPLAFHDWTKARMKLNSTRDQLTLVPGVSTGQLLKFFVDSKVCIETDVLLPSASYGGVFSGGCHGTGKNQPTMSDFIISMVVVDGNGDIKTIPDDYVTSSGPSKDEIMKAARVSLGLFGVILEFTIEVKPMKYANVINSFHEEMSIFQSKTKLSSILNDYDSIELFWFPFNSIFDSWGMLKYDNQGMVNLKNVDIQCLTRGVLKANQKHKDAIWDPYKDKLWIREINFVDQCDKSAKGMPFFCKLLNVAFPSLMNLTRAIIGSLYNKLTPLTMILTFKLMDFQYGICRHIETVEMPWALHYMDGVDLTACNDMEFAFPLNINDPQVMMDAVQVVVDITKSYFYDGGQDAYPLNLCMELRVMKKSEAYLCPASLGTEDHILYLEVLGLVNTVQTKKYWHEIADKWMEMGGVPHWQKQWTFLNNNGSMIKYLAKNYGDNLTSFKRVRSQIGIDPDNLFVNHLFEQLLGQ